MSYISVFNPEPPPLPGQRTEWGNLTGCSAGLAISQLAININTPLVLITSDNSSLQRLLRELHFFSQKATLPILKFPDWETLPYDHFSPHSDIISERLTTLYKLSTLKKGIVACALSTLMHRLPPRDYLTQNAFLLSIGEKIDITSLREKLVHCGYRFVNQVMEHGEFAIRGAIMDIYPMGSPLPYRFELFDDEVESIRSFDPENQMSINKMESIELLPAHEFPLTEEAITRFRQNWRNRFTGNPLESPIYKSISSGESAPGIEYYLPLFFEKTQTFFEYLPEKTPLIFFGDLYPVAQNFWDELHQRYEQLRYDIRHPLCEPQEIFLRVDETFASLNTFPQIQIRKDPLPEKKGHVNYAAHEPPMLLINHKAENPLEKVQDFSQNFSGRVLFSAETNGRKAVLLDLINDIKIYPRSFETWQDFLESKEIHGITIAPLDIGLLVDTPSIALITESQLFGEQVMQRRLRKAREQDPELMIRNLTELNIGSPVVHIDHGVGRYQGLQLIKTNDIEAEYLTLEYADGDKIYVPVTSLHLISRYTGSDPEHAPVYKLGSKKWDKIKEKVAKQIRDVAADLLDIYSRRQASPGFAFPNVGHEFQIFRSNFPFEETPDQSRAIDEVIKDMVSARSMDRLICGDVGFGKTEVAIQAAFIAAHTGKQVAVLVPTTLLANQHFQSFSDRFAEWPIKIALLSRFRTKKEQETTLKDLTVGKVDIVIGTHALLQKDVKFKDLGLLIIDEEHRFGVRQKERIKALRAHVDILTLTATPIPRTLNMALAGTRDLSIISTPPARRLSIKTFVNEFDPGIIREAILRETMRGGQVYFLHNDVASIEKMAEKIQTIVPDARITVAHGQMHEHDLERVMTDFYHQKFNVLVCSTIIESGIDIPTANTIIMNRADRFGLAQLHQLRGRVGRSHHQAYAYLLVDSFKLITSDAEKRLEAITSMEDLGAGFHLAMHDLEIRGAGELLGEEQSGQIEAIGFSLYMEMLEEAVSALKEGKEPAFEKTIQHGPEIDFHISALIPPTYVPDVYTRLTLYKRLSSSKTKDQMENLKVEMIDRFGKLPEVTQNLFRLAELKLLAEPIGISKIDVGSEFGYIQFEEKPNIDPKIIIDLIQKFPNQYQLQGANRLRFKVTEKEIQPRINETEQQLKKLKTQNP